MGTFVALSSSLSSRHAKAWVPHVSPCCAGSTSLQFGAGTNQQRPLVKFRGVENLTAGLDGGNDWSQERDTSPSSGADKSTV